MRRVAMAMLLVTAACGTLLTVAPDEAESRDAGIDGGTPADAALASDSVSLNPSAPRLLTKGHGAIGNLAVDGDSVYFDSSTNRTLGRVPKGGGDVAILLPDASLRQPTGLVADGLFVYASAYTAGAGDGARRVPKNGGPEQRIDPCNTAWSIGVDSTDIYWLTGDCGGNPRLRGRGKDERDAAATVESIEDDGGGYGYAQDGYMALDSTHVYWTSAKQIKALPKAAIDGAPPLLVYTAGPSDAFRALAVADRLYAVVRTRVIAVSKDGMTATVLVPAMLSTGRSDTRAAIAVADGMVYFTVPNAGFVGRVATTGGAVTAIATGQGAPTALALDESYVYWANADDGSIWRVSR